MQNKIWNLEFTNTIEWAFSIARLLIALRHCHLQMDNMDWIIAIVKNWPHDPLANYKPNFDFKQYLKTLVEDKYDLIGKHDFLKNCKLMVTNFVGWGGFVWGIVGLGNLCYN
jgi:hypothetical protein